MPLFLRPSCQVEPLFAQFKWEPKWITPSDERNRQDMLELLRWRLAKEGHVAAGDLEAAAQLMLQKSEVGGQGRPYRTPLMALRASTSSVPVSSSSSTCRVSSSTRVTRLMTLQTSRCGPWAS
jgi:hypothetical protein